MKKHALLIDQSNGCLKKALWEQLNEEYHLFFSKNRSKSIFYLRHESINCIVTELSQPGPLSEDDIAYFRTSFQTIPIVVCGLKNKYEAEIDGSFKGFVHCVPQGNMNKLARALPTIITENNYYVDFRRFEIDQDRLSPRVKKALRLIKKDYLNRNLTVNKIASMLNINRCHFEREFKSQCRISPKQLIIGLKLHYSTHLMKNDGMKLLHVARFSGFSDYYSFCKIFRKHLGLTPTQYRCAQAETDPFFMRFKPCSWK